MLSFVYRFSWLRLVVLLIGVGLAMSHAAPIHAEEIEVACDVPTLAAAVTNAASGSILNLAAGCTYTLTNPYFGLYGLPAITKTLTIYGNNTVIERSLVAGTASFGLITIGNNGDLTLLGLTLRNGKNPGERGGGIYNNGGTLTLIGSTLSNNSAAEGGGIHNYFGTVFIINSTLSDNSVTNVGGGLLNAAGSVGIINSTFYHNTTQSSGGAIWNDEVLAVIGSTFANNSANFQAGGLGNDYGTATVSNSTFNGNSANSYGGALLNGSGTLSITNSTIFGNAVISGTGRGGGIYSMTGTVKLGSSIAASNGGNYGPNAFGPINSLGHNLIDNTSNITFSGDTHTNLTGDAASPLYLYPLADNGGSTQTMELGEGSAAVGSGDCTDVSFDQRGAARKSPCDIGAYETNSPVLADAIMKIKPQGYPTPPNPGLVMQLHVIMTPQGDSTPVFDDVVTTDEYGEFELSGATPGIYHFWLKGTNTLSAAQDITLSSGLNFVDFGLLPTGDTDGNNVVNLTDFSLLAGTFGKQNGNPGYDGRADFNSDKVINLTDFSLLVTNFGHTGAP